MKSLPSLRLLALAIPALLAVTQASAQETYYYGGVAGGPSRAKIDEDRIAGSLLGTGLVTTGMTRDERDMAYKLFAGYQFSRNFALEAGYFNLGKYDFTAFTRPTGTLHGQFKIQGFNLDLVGTLPLTERFSVFARAGAQAARTRDEFSGTGAVNVINRNPSKREVNYKGGVGMQYEFNPSFLIRAEVERYRINDAVGNRGNVDTATLSLVFPFGRSAPPRVARVMPEYSYVAPVPAAPMAAPMPPAPAPIVAAPVAPPAMAPAPARRRVSFAAESLFAFDQANIKPEGQAALEKFAADLQGTEFAMVVVEGHTDRLGSDAYNQRLSTQRANAVKAYLVSPGRVDAAKISAVGKGESMPVTTAGQCKGSRANAALIACLQPDRRVDVEVSGTR
jgi:OOP family OmpA-OmpF porin